ncbi:MAG: DinB family protein [Casimicrobium sp.]
MSPEIEFAWRTNNAVNDVLLDHLTPPMLEAVTPGGGYTVAQHLAHMVEATKYWLSVLEPSAAEPLEDLFDNFEDFNPSTDLAQIRRVMHATRDAALHAAKTVQNKGDLPHSSPSQFLFHAAIHDAHHRGQIMLALKAAGFALPDDGDLWRPLKT